MRMKKVAFKCINDAITELTEVIDRVNIPTVRVSLFEEDLNKDCSDTFVRYNQLRVLPFQKTLSYRKCVTKLKSFLPNDKHCQTLVWIMLLVENCEDLVIFA